MSVYRKCILYILDALLYEIIFVIGIVLLAVGLEVEPVIIVSGIIGALVCLRLIIIYSDLSPCTCCYYTVISLACIVLALFPICGILVL